jgi:hypothetical protein
MIAELADNVSPKMKYGWVDVSVPKDAFPSARYEREDRQCLRKCKHQTVTDVSHKSIGENLIYRLSILRMSDR